MKSFFKMLFKSTFSLLALMVISLTALADDAEEPCVDPCEDEKMKVMGLCPENSEIMRKHIRWKRMPSWQQQNNTDEKPCVNPCEDELQSLGMCPEGSRIWKQNKMWKRFNRY